MRFPARIAVIVLCVSTVVPTWTASAQSARDEVDRVLTAFHEAASDGDFGAYFSLFAREAVFIGTDDWERWSRSEFEDYARPIFARGSGWTYTMTERHIRIAGDGQTAWFDEMLDNSSMGTARGSGTLIREDGTWKVALYNLSLPVPNELSREFVARIREFDAASHGPANRIEALVDSIAAALTDSADIAGMAVGVVQDGDTLVLKQYGYADLEYRTPTPPHAVFDIGSITKQFTAAGIYRLVERGLIDLDADLTTYLPDFDTQGHRLTIARMLDHTSGIQGYTEKREFGSLTVQDLPRDSLVTLLETWPFWHEPGAQVIYNNSAYFLLGLVIEKVAGTSYEQFLETEFFQPLGMQDSRYCSNTAVVPNRMRGYSRTPAGFERADYLNHRWPYAAGSICSSVEDLLTWNAALHAGRVLGPEAYASMITPRALDDGSMIRYAGGLGITETDGRTVIAHGGGINGFLSQGMHFPGDHTTVVVLVNATEGADPGEVAADISDALYGTPATPSPRPLDIDPGDLVGTWSGTDRGGSATYTIERDGDGFAFRNRNRPAVPLVYVGEGWFRPNTGTMRVGLVRAKDGALRLHVDTVGGYTILTRGG